MTPKIIKNEAEHAAALARIEQLFDAERGTPEGDELELLVMLVEQFEEAVFPMKLPDPIAAVRFRVEQRGLRSADLVPFLGSRSKVSEVMSGSRGLSLQMIRRLVRGLDIPAEVLIGKPGAELKSEKELHNLRQFPLAAMRKLGWFPWFSGTLAEAKEQTEDLLTRFAGQCGVSALQPALNRQHIRDGSRCDDFALAAWRIRVMNIALKDSLPIYRKGVISPEFLSGLAQLSLFETGPALAAEFLRKSGIHFVVEPHLPKTHLDGAAMKMPDGAPLVALTLRHDRLDNFWFTLFHELAHVQLHLDGENFEAFFDDLNQDALDRCEKEADDLAHEALLSEREWKLSGLAKHAPVSAVIKVAQELRISPSIVAGRVRHKRKNFMLLGELVGRGKVRCLFPEARNR